MRQRFNLPPRWGCDVDEYQTPALTRGLFSRRFAALGTPLRPGLPSGDI